jgi:glycosyltransferase involved in cell wall biosynthesis
VSSTAAAPERGSPTVSVVIPCYNYGHYLPEAVRSVIQQPGVLLDIIIVDDASTDGSRDIARSIASNDNRIRLIEHETNKGHIATYNDGLAAIHGDFVVLLSADDLLAPGALKRSTDLMREHPRVSLVYGFAPEFTDEPPAVRTTRTTVSVWKGQDWIARICARGTNAIVNPEAMLRRSVMDDLVGYDVTMPHSADLDLWMRAAVRGDVGRVNGPNQAFYRVHTSNMHLTDYAGLLADMRARSDTFDRFFEGDGRDLEHASSLHVRARSAIARGALEYAHAAGANSREIGGATPIALTEFAAEVWPPIVFTLSYRLLQRRQRVPARNAFFNVRGRIHSLKWAMRWRRWRRYGL